MQHPRIVIVDDHQILLDALQSLVEPEFEVVATFRDCPSLLKGAVDLRPDVIVLDIGMPVMSGLSAGEYLKKLLPKTKLIFLTADQGLDTAAEAFKLGASAYVLKIAAASELKTAIREVLRGGYYASPILTDGMTGSFVQTFKRMKSPYQLTLRQKEVLKLLSEGFSMKEVGQSLNITSRTVAFHKYTMMEQLEIKTNAELIAFARSQFPAWAGR